MLTEPLVHTMDLDADHPLAYVDVACVVCGVALHSADNTNVAVWVETGKGGMCANDFAATAVINNQTLQAGYALGVPTPFIETVRAQHTPVDTEHGPCCYQCSATAVDSDYRVLYPCPTLLKAQALDTGN